MTTRIGRRCLARCLMSRDNRGIRRCAVFEATGLWGQTVRFDGKLLEVGPRAGGLAAYYPHPVEEARTETAIIWLDEIRKIRFHRPSWLRHGYLRLFMRLRPEETAKPFWWTEPTEHPRVASIEFLAGQQSSFEALRDAVEQARRDL
jgi:hypothetical protein